jgi:multimeric flavodoxin WrbA
MKILVVHGSMRKGKTYALTKEIMSRLGSKEDVEFVEISVRDLGLPFCVSCHVCFSKGEEHCPNYEHVRDVQAALRDCDGVILSGTTYMWALNAAMKNLMDHLAYGFHRPSLFGKKGMVIATSKGNGEKAVAKYLKMALGQWGVNGAVVVTRNSKEEQLLPPSKLTAKLDRRAEKFYRQIASKRPAKPSLRSIAVHNAFRSMALSEFSEFEADTQYWQQESANRAYPVKAGVFRCAVGAAVFGIASLSTKIIGRRLKGR